jgi:hypothetical protein
MSAEFRMVEVAPSKVIRVRRSRAEAQQAGRIVVENSRRGRFEIPAERWAKGEVCHG